MKQLFINTALVLLFGLFTASCSRDNDMMPEADPASLPNTQEFAVVQNFVNAINAGNRSAAIALTNAETGYAYSMNGTLSTGQSFLNWLESDLFAPNARIVIESATQNGNTVNIVGRWGRNGNATNRANYFFTVQNGIITAWRLV
jgi:hypothetical protein